MSTYLSLGRGASLVCPPTPVKAKASLVGQPTLVYFLTYLLTYLPTFIGALGAKLVYPPTSV